MALPPTRCAFLLLLVACAPRVLSEADERSGDSTAHSGDGHSDTETDADGDTDSDTDSEMETTAVIYWVAPSIGDTTGGGGRVVLTLDSSVGATAATLGGVALTAFAIDDATHVSGIPGPHDAGLVDVVVTNAAGPSTGGKGLFEYWTPVLIENLDAYLDADKGLSLTGDEALMVWTDQGPNARVFTQKARANQPSWQNDVFGSMPGLHFTAQQYLSAESPIALWEAGSSIFAVARWTATTDVTPPPGNAGNVPLTIVGDRAYAYGAFGAKGGAVESNHYTGNANLVDRGLGLNDGVARLIGASYDTSTFTQIYVGNTQQGVDDVTAPFIGLNTYDTIGAGWPGADGWDGDLAAVVVVSGVIDVADRTKLDVWAQQRWGTPVSPTLDKWSRERLSEMPYSPDEWYPRDGTQMVQLDSGRILMIGGWSPYDPWGGDRVTNEVWASDDLGATWSLLLPHDPSPPTSGKGARFPPGHTIGVTTYRGHAIVLGTDCLRPPLLGDVWQESDEGQTWTRVSTSAPTAGRCLFMTGNLGDDLYVMGGQANLYDESTAIADVWRSSDGGQTWIELDPPPWSGRGMVYHPAEVGGTLVIVGGGRYDETDNPAFNGVFAFDGSTWTTVLPDGHDQWTASYYNALAALDDRLWLFNGFDGIDNLCRAIYSDDGGATWTEYPGGSGGRASHADDVLALHDRVLRVSGDLSERAVWAFRP
jgi:hypothetical protein